MRIWLFTIAVMVLVAGLPGPATYAQRNIQEGEKLPDFVLGNLYNTTQPELAFSTLKKKKLILFDFWSPSCKGCLLSFPKMDSLQRLFAGQLQVVMVNQQSLESTKHLFEKRKFLFRPDLPFATADTLLNSFFKISVLPAIAWVDDQGVFQKMTSTVTTTTIRKFLADGEVSLDSYAGTARYISPFDTAMIKNVVYSTYLSKAESGTNLRTPGKDGISMTFNAPIDLYIEAFNEIDRYDFRKPGRLIVNLKDSSPFLWPVNKELHPEWEKENLYNYALLLPNSTKAEKFIAMQQDLQRYFKVRARVEKREVNAWVLVRTTQKDLLKTKGISGPITFSPSDIYSTKFPAERKIMDRPYELFSRLFENWIRYKLNMPVVDQTNYTGNIDISFAGETVDRPTLPLIKKELRRYGLDLIEKKVFIEVLVLGDK